MNDCVVGDTGFAAEVVAVGHQVVHGVDDYSDLHAKDQGDAKGTVVRLSMDCKATVKMGE